MIVSRYLFLNFKLKSNALSEISIHKMFKTSFSVFVIISLYETSIARYCEPKSHSKGIFNINRDIYIVMGDGTEDLLYYNLDTKEFHYLKLDEVFGKSKSYSDMD